MKKKIALLMAVLVMLSGLSINIGAEKSEAEKKSSLLTGQEIATIEGVAAEPSFAYASEQAMLAEMQLIADNANYSLYLHTSNLAIAVLDKKANKIHFSNPYNAKSDPYYTGAIAQRLDSQFVLNYVDPDNVSQVIFSSTDAVALGQYSIKTYANGAKVEYSIGEEIEQPMFPKVISEKRFKEVLSKLSESDAYGMDIYYTRTDLSEVTDANRKKELLDMYPQLKKEVLYITPSEMSQREQLALTEIFTSIGYDEKQYTADSEEYGFEKDINNNPNFKFTVEYVLTEEGLTVNIPYNSIKFDSVNFRLQNIEVLPYLAADKPGSGNGYLFIPDGSGAIIDINQTQANRSAVITGDVYGQDMSNIPSSNGQKLISQNKQYYLPVYGAVKNDGTGVFAVIESGSELSAISARLGAPNSLYYCTYNSFSYTSNIPIVKDTKKSSMHSAQSLFLFDKNLHNTDFTMSYYFLSGNNASYSGMADIYRDKLVKAGMQKNEDAADTKFVLETIGSALYDDNFLGFSYQAEAELTTYAQNLEILKYFNEKGIKDPVLVLSGWQKNGLDATLNKKIKLSSKLGGKKEFKSLVAECEELSVPLYIEHNVMFASSDKAFDAYNKKRDTAKCMDSKYSGIYSLDYDTRLVDIYDFTITSSKYSKLLEKFFKSSNSYSVKNVDLSGFGKYLTSDFNEKKNATNRMQAREDIVEVLAKYSKENNISVDGANAYVIPYVKQIRDLTMTNSALIGETAAVPFVQMVLSGSVSYSSEAINLAEEPMREVLSCIETATSPSFTLAYGNIELLKLTDYNYMYACGFENLRERAVEYYGIIDKALASTEGSALVKHEVVAENVSLSYFANGSVICVNKGNSNYKLAGKDIPAMSYVTIK